MARRSKGGAGRGRQLGGRGDPQRGYQRGVPGSRPAADEQWHPHHRERSDRFDRRGGREQQTRDLLPLDDGPEGGGHHRHLRQYRSYQVVWRQHILQNETLPVLRLKRRHFLLAILAVGWSERAAYGEARRFRVAFANLNEEPGVSIEGLGFSGAEIRRSFELASRGLPLDMIYYDNGGDAGKALANAADAVSRKVDMLIEYNSDAEANAEIGRQLKAAGIPVFALNHPIPGAPLYAADDLAAGKIAGETLGQFAKENWPDQTLVAAILGDVADPSPFVAARIQGVTEGLRQELPNV